MKRREFLGVVEETTLSADVITTDTSIPLTSGSSYPTGSTNPFVIVINRGLSNEEKILCASRSGNTITVEERGYDGTTAQNHTSGDLVDHVLDANTVQSMNTVTFDNAILIWSGIGG
jgi:hypothetical protein